MLSLVKGQRISFAKESPGLRSLILKIHWNVKGNTGARVNPLEVDMSAFLLDQTGKCKSDSDIVFYGNTSGRGQAVIHSGKSEKNGLVGEGLKIELPNMPIDVETMAVTLSIYEAEQRQQDFSMVESISATVLDGITGNEICHFPISWNFTIETAIVVCEIYKKNGEWRFNAVGAGYQGGLASLCNSFGLDVNDEGESGSQPVISEPPAPQARPIPPIAPPIPPPIPPIPVILPQPTVQSPPIPTPPVPPLTMHSTVPPVPPPSSANHMPPPPPIRLVNEPLASGSTGVRLGGNRQINLGNPHAEIHLGNSGTSETGGNPAPKKFNFSQQQITPPTPVATSIATPAFSQSIPPNLSRCRCGAELRPESKFCTGCGTPVAQSSPPPIVQEMPTVQCCANCRTTLRSGSKFCTGCGKPV